MDSAFQDLCRQLEIELAHSLANQAKAQVEISAYKELAIALCNELISRCNDPIHKNQLEELTK